MTIQILSVCDQQIFQKTFDRVKETQKLLTKINSNLDILDPKIISHVPNVIEQGVKLETAMIPVNKDNYSFYMAKILPQHLESDYILVVQYDSGIINTDAWTDEFLEYEYIGAPWKELNHLRDFFGHTVRVGNGGFSLRSVRLQHTISQLMYPYPFPYPTQDFYKEDVHMVCKLRHVLEDRGIKFGNLYIANKFAAETGLKDKNKLPFGAHGTLYDEIIIKPTVTAGEFIGKPIDLMNKNSLSDLKLKF